MNIHCQNCQKNFSIDQDDQNFYQNMEVPPPTFCPECRLQRRLTFRNDRTLYYRNCTLCDKQVLSIYRPNGPIQVVCQKCWWSDAFDPKKYAKDFDPEKPFFDQFKELMGEIPFVANFVVDESRMLNSPYNNMVLDLKNCYFMFNADFDEDCLYGCEVEKSKNCMDVNLVDESELCYECVNIQNCYRAFYSIDCESSSNLWFCRDCNGCTDCFGCVNLRKQSYCIWNVPMGSKDAYDAKLKELGLDTRDGIEKNKKEARELWKRGIYKYMHEKQNQDATGDYIYNSRSITQSWIVHEGWNVKYSQYLVAPNVKDSYDFTQFGNNVEKFYEVLQGGNGGSRVRFSWFVPNENRELDYCMQVMTSHDLFGCIGMRKTEYCILNKQYTKEEYENIRSQIIEQMSKKPYVDRKEKTYTYGEFFPSDLSPFAYNETTAQEYFPVSETEAVQKGYTWFEKEKRNYIPTILKDNIPKTAGEISDSICSEIIECVHNGMNLEFCVGFFKTTENEINFYKKFNLPLPSKCPNCRHHERMELRNTPVFTEKRCAENGCQETFVTAYTDITPYCKKHYLEKVI